jgi:hypothetical protein
MDKIRGVNLGNWLVLEKWMAPQVFEGTTAEDETDLCLQLGEQKYARLKEHRDSYIGVEDFVYMRNRNLTDVRLPVPHFVFGGCEPYVGCIDYVDKAFEWAEAAGLRILIDLHTAPESQNGFDNGGICGVCKWHTKRENIDRTLLVLEMLAARYKMSPALYGIELLNEPISEELFLKTRRNYPPSDLARASGSCAVPIEVLYDFYSRGYEAVRRHLDEDKAVMIHDGFRLQAWKDFMRGPAYRNVVLDTHFYVGMGLERPKGGSRDLIHYLKLGLDRYRESLIEMAEYFPIVVGEWCLAHYPDAAASFTPLERQYAYRAIADTQLFAWEKALGWYFWSYKLQAEAPGWDFRDCVAKGWLPENLEMGR